MLEGRAKELVLIRPAVEAGRSIGYLKGDLDEKIAPYHMPFEQALAKIAFKFPETQVRRMAVGFCQGITFEDSVVIIDEAQNASYFELKMLITRLGNGSKMIFCGDSAQSAIRPRDSYYRSDLEEVTDQLEGVTGIGIVDFLDSDVVRHPKLGAVLRALERSDDHGRD